MQLPCEPLSPSRSAPPVQRADSVARPQSSQPKDKLFGHFSPPFILEEMVVLADLVREARIAAGWSDSDAGKTPLRDVIGACLSQSRFAGASCASELTRPDLSSLSLARSRHPAHQGRHLHLPDAQHRLAAACSAQGPSRPALIVVDAPPLSASLALFHPRRASSSSLLLLRRLDRRIEHPRRAFPSIRPASLDEPARPSSPDAPTLLGHLLQHVGAAARLRLHLALVALVARLQR